MSIAIECRAVSATVASPSMNQSGTKKTIDAKVPCSPKMYERALVKP